MSERTLTFASTDQLSALCGSFDKNLQALKKAYPVELVVRDCDLKIIGEEPALSQCERAVQSILSMIAADLRTVDPGKKEKKQNDPTTAPKGIRKLLEPGAMPVSACILLCTFGYAALISFYRLYAIKTNLVSEFSCFFLVYAAVLTVSRLSRMWEEVHINLDWRQWKSSVRRLEILMKSSNRCTLPEQTARALQAI